ncbi:RagB/SusD family nutrient uptake outer membrane protein [Soonwooa purpurea]
MKNTLYLIVLSSFSLLINTGCRDLLDEKSDAKLSVPSSLADNQALLDMFVYANTEFTSSGETSADDYYLTDADYNSLYFEEIKRLYTWQPDHVSLPASSGNDWSSTYRSIYIANSVLHNLEYYNLKGAEANNIKAQAYALRGIRYLDAVQIWCLAYNPHTAKQDLGLPLRLDPDMNLPSKRSSLQETYQQIINDLSQAIIGLPNQQSAKTRLSKTAAYAYLARTYLIMGDYEKALDNAEQALSLNNRLMDFNNLDASSDYPIPDFNEEITFWGAMRYESHLMSAKISQNIYNMYDDNDLRKSIYFNTNNTEFILFKGYYNNANGPSVAVATDELYLIAAESYARLNQLEKAMDYLNALLSKRWKTGTYIPISATTKDEALAIIKTERRKELMFRGTRWSDIKRYNRDGDNISLTRTINEKIYNLPANDLRYAIAIPEDVIKITGMPQNPR